MVSRSVLVASVSAFLLALGPPAFASPPGDGGGHGGGGGGGGGGSSSPSSSSGGGGSSGSSSSSGGGGGSHGGDSGGGHAGGGGFGGGRSGGGSFSPAHAGPSGSRGDGARMTGGGGGPTGQRAGAQADRPTALTAWMGSNNTSARAHVAAVWRSQNHGFDRNAAWKRGGDWWKGRPGFRGYHGHHRHHPFIPDLGYVEVSDDCPFDTLEIGELAPRCATLYGLSDWASYGLPSPPPGCRWVWLDGDIALVQISDGYVIDIVRQVF